jgi:hypothetical protein
MAYKPKRMPKQTINKRRLKLHPIANKDAGINNEKSVRIYSCCEKWGKFFTLLSYKLGKDKKNTFY